MTPYGAELGTHDLDDVPRLSHAMHPTNQPIMAVILITIFTLSHGFERNIEWRRRGVREEGEVKHILQQHETNQLCFARV